MEESVNLFFHHTFQHCQKKKVFTFNTGKWDLIVLFQELKQVVREESCNEVPLRSNEITGLQY